MLQSDDGYTASLLVKNQKGALLWDHDWIMMKSDLDQMMEEEGRKSIEDCVKNFFSHKPLESDTFSMVKLKEEDLIPSYIKVSANQIKVNSNNLIKAILIKRSFLFFITGLNGVRT